MNQFWLRKCCLREASFLSIIDFRSSCRFLNYISSDVFQLVLTALLTSIVIYLYTVVAFNFFRDSYVEEAETVADIIAPTIGFLSNDTSNLFANHVTPSDPGSETAAAPPGSVMEQQKCANMWQCFIFHLHHGLRAGGGIGDEIEDPDGQDLMYMRIIFDMTFFFFVIVILLAIIQGGS